MGCDFCLIVVFRVCVCAGLVFSADGSVGLLGGFHIYMRHTSGERHLLSSLWISHANIKSVKMMIM